MRWALNDRWRGVRWTLIDGRVGNIHKLRTNFNSILEFFITGMWIRYKPVKHSLWLFCITTVNKQNIWQCSILQSTINKSGMEKSCPKTPCNWNHFDFPQSAETRLCFTVPEHPKAIYRSQSILYCWHGGGKATWLTNCAQGTSNKDVFVIIYFSNKDKYRPGVWAESSL